MIVTKSVTMKWAGLNKIHYIDKGYVFTKIGDTFDVKVEDLMSSTKVMVEYKCDDCGKPNETFFGKLDLHGKQYCRPCSISLASRKRNAEKYEGVKKEFEDRDYILISKEFIKVKDKLTYICKNHKDQGEQNISYVKFQEGQGCRKCGNERAASHNRYSIEQVNKFFEDKNCILLSTEYVNQDTELEYICLHHKDIGVQKTILGNYNINKHSCPNCFLDSQKYTFEQVKEMFNKNGLILLEEEYINYETMMKFKCQHHEGKGIMELPTYEVARGRGCKWCSYEISIPKITGENHYNWKGGIYDDESDKFRRSYAFKKWRSEVYMRDRYTCQCCCKIGGVINAHHLDGYNWCEEKRVDIDNGVTLCEDCHTLSPYSFHSIYGRGQNTKEQFVEWLQEYQELNVS